MDNGPGWMADPDHEGQERYWNGSAWTDKVRPAITAGRLHLPEHVPELQRALAAATADIDAVEDRLSILFDRSEGKIPPADQPRPAAPSVRSDAELETQADAELEAEHETEAVVDEADAGGAAGDGGAENQRTDNGEGIEASGGDDADDADDEDGAFAELDAELVHEKPSRFRFRSRKRS